MDPIDVIIIVIVVLIIAAISYYLIRAKRRGETCIGCPYAKQCAKTQGRSSGGCCSSGGYKLKPKKLKSVIYKRDFTVENMHCESCKRRVEETVNDIKGVAGLVSLAQGRLTVSYSEDVADDVIIERLDRVGYKAYREDFKSE